MNYFERLVRRALLRPASQPGAALADPFDEVAEWPLESPLSAPAGKKSPAENVAPPLTALAADRQIPNPPTVNAPKESMPGVARGHVIERPPTQTLIHAVTPEASREPPATPLEVADRFMRELGIAVPGRLNQPSPPPAPAMPERRHPEEPARQPAATRLQQIVAPPSPSIAMTPESVETTGGTPSEARGRAPAATSNEAIPRNRPPSPPNREVVVERVVSTTSAEPSRWGGGSPRFGLGQL